VTLWRLERLRLFRTRRWIAILGVYLFFGLIGPLTARYANQIFGSLGAQDGPKMIFPPATVVEGIATYIKNVTQIGLLVLVVVAAGALSFDSKPTLAAFYRTRVRSASQLVLPRFTVNAVAGAAGFIIGGLAAWYETELLIGHVPPVAILEGLVLECLYLAFAVAVVALSATVVSSQLNTVMLSLGVLIALPIMALVRGVSTWLPSYLVAAPNGLVGGQHLTDFARATCVTLIATVICLWLAIRRSADRET
jgi:ABC-2 type transport system permease protein